MTTILSLVLVGLVAAIWFTVRIRQEQSADRRIQKHPTGANRHLQGWR